MTTKSTPSAPGELHCAECDRRVCRGQEDCFDAAARVRRVYEEADEATLKLSRVAAAVESEGYMRWPRALEIIRFAQRAEFDHLGIAFCIGLAEEARVFSELLGRHFRVSSVCCKACGIPKDLLGLDQLRAKARHETMCSPLGQALLLNEAATDLNVALGLCVGHDALFAKQSEAPVTTLIAKDRVLAHNPAGALYSRYWRRVLNKK